MIIALFGPPGAGKDTVGKILVEEFQYRRVAFADKVRELALKLHGSDIIDIGYGDKFHLRTCVEAYGWERVKRDCPDAREILERVGDGCREVLGDTVWINAVWHDVITGGGVVITDMRKENEYEALLDIDAQFWLITREGCKKRPFDEWEPEWAYDAIENDGTLEELRKKVRSLIQ